MAGMARRLRALAFRDSYFVHEHTAAVAENEMLVQRFGTAHRIDISSCSSPSVCSRGFYGIYQGIACVPAEYTGSVGTLCWRIGGELRNSKQEGLAGFMGTVVARSFATRDTQMRRLAKQPVKRDGAGQRSGGRSVRGRAVGGESGGRHRGNFQKREGAALNSGSDAAGSRKRWGAKRSSERFDTLDEIRIPVKLGRISDSNVMKSSTFQGFQLRRRGLEETEAEDTPSARKRRVMRLHPSDQTNKRIVDDFPTFDLRAEVVKPKSAEKCGEEIVDGASSSQNAQFRAIQPLPEILRHIDTHLLGRRRLWEWRNGGYHIKLKAPLDDIPHGSKEGRLPIQETVFKRKLTFAAAAKVSRSLPSLNLPEIAFAGRSNVGKSSLINALTRQWGVVRTSDKPGMTQSVNFFTLGSRLCLVDLPGYGFAYAKEEAKEAWEDLVKEYVTTRKILKRVCLLVDSKWGLKPRDEELIELMENAQTKYQIVLTKTDILPPLDLARRATQIQEALKHHKQLILPVLMVSSQTGGGIPHLRKALVNLALSGTNQQ